MQLIYEPKGRAREYAELACNLFMGCPHGCTYCSAPGTIRKQRDDFHGDIAIKPNVLERLERDCMKMADAGDEREVLFCFICDPFPHPASLYQEQHLITFHALGLMRKYGLRSTVLTKNPLAAEGLFPEFLRGRIRLGVTLSFYCDGLRRVWEPKAASVSDRIHALAQAKEWGVETWVSVEPVIDPDDALRAIEAAMPYVDEWKIGKWNHDVRAKKIDWPLFYQGAKKLLESKRVIWKKDLLEAAGVQA